MQSRSSSVLVTLRNVQAFLDNHTTVLGTVNQELVRQKLDAVVERLQTMAVSQDGGTRKSMGETARQRALRLALRVNHMRPIAEIAKFELRDQPEFVKLRMPGSRTTGQQLIAAAGGMAEAAEPHAAVFVAHGLAADFIEQLRGAADALSASLKTRSVSRQERAGATQALRHEEAVGRQVLNVLDSLVRAKIGGDAALIGAWKEARRIPAKPGPARGSIVEANAAPPVTPDTPQAA